MEEIERLLEDSDVDLLLDSGHLAVAGGDPVAALAAAGYEGWVVVEQDRVLENGDAFRAASAEQTRNRVWLREHAGW